MRNSILSASFFGCSPNVFNLESYENSKESANIKKSLYTQICKLYENGVEVFYTGCYVGMDMWAAEIVLELQKYEEYKDIKLICCIPYEEQAAKWPFKLRERYYTILEKSDCNIFIKRRFSQDCFIKCSEFMIQHSHFLISLCDNKENYCNSNFAKYVLSYAMKLSKGIIIINPKTAKVTPITISAKLT